MKLIYYKDNKTLGIPTVITIHGEVEYHANCKKYVDGYYVKNIDLELNGRIWVKKEKETFDNEKGIYTKNVYDLIYGIISVDKEEIPVFGHFSPNKYKNCKVHSRETTYNCISFDILPEKLYKEKISEGIYYRLDEITPAQRRTLHLKQLLLDNKHCNYNIEDNKNNYAAMIKLYEDSKIPIDSDIKQIAKYIGDITFGIELETINGILPEHIRNKYGVIICKDGSIKNEKGYYPPEYVTVPYKGAKGLQAIRNLSAEIQKRSDINILCSYHAHIGGFLMDRMMLVSLFKLCCKIQKDVFKMFPYYKRNPSGIKQQNYCKSLPNILSNYNSKDFNKYINDAYGDMYVFLTGGNKLGKEYNVRARINPWGANKWDIETRYYWVNFINPIFGKRKTIEFRIHTPTLNPDKILNWLFMCIAIIRFAENNTKKCVTTTTIGFEDVLNYYKEANATNRLSEKLIAYYRDRVEYFNKDIERKDFQSLNELINDEQFKFDTISQ